MIQNPDDDVNLLRILNTPTRGIGNATAELAREHSIAKKFSVFEALKDADFHAQLSDRMRMVLTGFTELIDLQPPSRDAQRPGVKAAPKKRRGKASGLE